MKRFYNQSNLTFKFIANACGVFTGKDGTQILCDPWLVDGVFEGSWCHFHKLQTQIKDLQEVDAIYVSHLHPDHFDERYFNFDKSIPLIVLDHGPNFLIKKLTSLGYNNLIKIKDHQTVCFKEFELTMFSPFVKHHFHEAKVGDIINSALLLSCNGVSAFNGNDNAPSVESANMLRERYGEISIALLSYNPAGPYPSCFDNLTENDKFFEQKKLLDRNFKHLKSVINAMAPKFILPFAGAYVLGGNLYYKNKYLGTTTWDECADWLNEHNIEPTKVVLLRENDILEIDTGISNNRYIPVDTLEMHRYINEELSNIKYPYEYDDFPTEESLITDLETAVNRMIERINRYKISSQFKVIIDVYNKYYQIYPSFIKLDAVEDRANTLICSMDERLLRNIIDKKSHWNNAEIGAHISFERTPNEYEPDLHIGLSFLHL